MLIACGRGQRGEEGQGDRVLLAYVWVQCCVCTVRLREGAREVDVFVCSYMTVAKWLRTITSLTLWLKTNALSDIEIEHYPDCNAVCILSPHVHLQIDHHSSPVGQ